MFPLIRRQEVFQHMAVWLVHTGLMTSVLLGLLAWNRAAGHSEGVAPAVLLGVAWFSLATLLRCGKGRRRCSDRQSRKP